MTPQRLAIVVALLAVTALVVVGLLQMGGGSPSTAASQLTLAQMRSRLTGSPARLATLHDQAAKILPGGLPALRARLASLRGTPLVVNKWASWCAPCRAESGVFQQVSLARGRQVAFVGIDSNDDHGNAVAFLRSFPVSYPSYFDAGGQAGLAVTDSSFTPVTVFFNRQGGEYIHQGPYLQASKLERDVARYALS
ncbi:MAG: cytochrome c biosis protein CcmG, thiol:disulfide interchange protein DsbE [Solirubrobacteraceae bacterium]|nr:TlpA family protein disulfide reductase [Solirubrobacterales bacterium]MEA2217115.1 cytochrome c biosis protein CcmG, thiol:disulfide interchange protein DsbE [Solirubrobacteraceae bacterium]